ncbi:MAG: hypothetical protein FVQ85_01495 [Planctomycetes bacterium]|nr:hypothetical protein [Planctomycetota bacterium]
MVYLLTVPEGPISKNRLIVTLQICRWAPRDNYGRLLCQGHHLQWLSRGGRDVLQNMVLICPNHHVAVHRCDSPFDYQHHAFHFPTHKERLLLNTHLK